MTITPLTVYLIMQADSIARIFMLGAFLIPVGMVIAAIFVSANVGYSPRAETEAVKSLPWKRAIGAFVIMVFLAALTPRTKTLCVMFVAPAIANSQAVQKDFPELYNLAVEKLKEQLAPAK